MSSFDGECLGDCLGFWIGERKDWYQFLTLYHSGNLHITLQFWRISTKQIVVGLDGGSFYWAIVTTDEGQKLKCYYEKFLEGGDFEVGKDCAECFDDCYYWFWIHLSK